MYDTISGAVSTDFDDSNTRLVEVLRYPKSIQLLMTLDEGSASSSYIPILTIDYYAV